MTKFLEFGLSTTQMRGKWAEGLSDDWFAAQGYACLEKNSRLCGTECDRLYLSKPSNRHVVFAEIKLGTFEPTSVFFRDWVCRFFGGPQYLRQKRLYEKYSRYLSAQYTNASFSHVLVWVYPLSRGSKETHAASAQNREYKICCFDLCSGQKLWHEDGISLQDHGLMALG